MDSIFSSKKNREALMDSEILQTSNQNQPSNYGLLRFRSAPSSLLGNYTNSCSAPKVSDSFEGFLNLQDFRSHRVQDLGNEPQRNLGTESAVNQRSFHNRRVSNSLLPPYYPRQSSVSRGDGGFSNLSRQGSSPPGLFNHLSVQNGYATMGGVGNTSGEVSPSPTGFKGVINYSSGLPSSLGLLSQISEVGSHSPGYAYGSWNENFNGVKRDPDGDGVLFPQNGELENHTSFLSHRLSLLKTPVEMASLEKFLQYPDSVPCKIRAKRGCATHPRSIAERVRRSRISERMRKLQELVPNMEKQTNTADMLDLAVEYIKDLQRQFKTLCDHRAKCKCSSLQKSAPNQIV